jgi:hypothetical protein
MLVFAKLLVFLMFLEKVMEIFVYQIFFAEYLRKYGIS